jgi:plastocyanin
MNRLLRLAAAAAAVAIAVAACSSGDDSASSAAPSAAATTSAAAATTSAPAGGGSSSSSGGSETEDSASITIQNFAFGEPLTVAPGTVVKVTNTDAAGHDLASDDAGKFKTPVLNQGESATFTAPTTPGTYKFSCTVHANMHGIGTLTVKG